MRRSSCGNGLAQGQLAGELDARLLVLELRGATALGDDVEHHAAALGPSDAREVDRRDHRERLVGRVDERLGARCEARIAKRLSVDPVLLGDAHRDVADRLVDVVERAGQSDREAPSGVAGDARVGDHGLVTHLWTFVAKRALEPLRGAHVADLTERGDRHLANVRIVVLHRQEEPSQGFDAAHVGERDRGLRADRSRRIAPERLLEQRERARARLMRAERVAHDVAYGGDTDRRLLRPEIAERGLEVSR